MQIIKHRKIYFAVSLILSVGSVVVIAVFGLKLGIDFTGGSLMEITVNREIKTSRSEIESILTSPRDPVNEGEGPRSPLLGSASAQATGENGYLIRFKDVTEQEHQEILREIILALKNSAPEGAVVEQEKEQDSEVPDISGIQATDSEGNPVDIKFEAADGGVISSPVITIKGKEIATEERFESIGPIIGQELKDKAIRAIIAVLAAIVLYIAWAFRKVSKPVSSWKYGIAAIVALAHDVIIPTGIFAVLGIAAGIEIDILFVTALLTILGFSVNDTIVVFDRTRENLSRDHHKHDFDYIVNKSVNETIRRSIYTSLTVFLVLVAIYFYGGESIKNFALALMIGVVVGTYSSIFLASPLLVVWEKWGRRR